TNSGDSAVTYELSFTDAVAAGGDPNNPSFSLATSTVEMPETVTVPAGSSSTFEVSIAPNEGLDLAHYGGYVLLTPDEGAPLRIPYAGFTGDYQDLPTKTDAGGDLPELASLSSCARLSDVGCVMKPASQIRAEGAKE